MKIFSEDRLAFIEIIFVESYMEKLPSINVSITVQNDGFTGVLESVWITIDDLKHFISCMDVIDVKRRGKANLTSMSPNEFILDFQTYDKCGHIKVNYTLTKDFSFPYFREVSLQGGFDIDSSEFLSIIKEFKKLLTK
ncbi:hypothetical protein OW763_13880 [Clostridium aestuarii]|uniref:Ribosome association toxin RatA n=1 Tax=Clostridium aestuarii TaxID=338193 RepID=A0ABT4D2G2_9CLOT|nr:hypothetical protein [Clostridium aestuarii]MCY6485421.1 hypothetical protein [Clostridium aestuarii]